MRGFFVTGTDTGVGKTVVSAVLAASRGMGYWKPIQTGTDDDTGMVRRLAGCGVWDRGVRLPDPVSPHLAARRAGTRIDVSDILAAAPAEGEWVVEGAGGVLVPINETETMLDLMEILGIPVIVAARTTLGTINHTLLTLAALRGRGLSVDRVVMVGHADRENYKAIEYYGRVQVADLPWLDPLTPEAVRGCRL